VSGACPFSVVTRLLALAVGGLGQGNVALLWNIGLLVRIVTGVPACLREAGMQGCSQTTCRDHVPWHGSSLLRRQRSQR